MELHDEQNDRQQIGTRPEDRRHRRRADEREREGAGHVLLVPRYKGVQCEGRAERPERRERDDPEKSERPVEAQQDHLEQPTVCDPGLAHPIDRERVGERDGPVLNDPRAGAQVPPNVRIDGKTQAADRCHPVRDGEHHHPAGRPCRHRRHGLGTCYFSSWRHARARIHR